MLTWLEVNAGIDDTNILTIRQMRSCRGFICGCAWVVVNDNGRLYDRERERESTIDGSRPAGSRQPPVRPSTTPFPAQNGDTSDLTKVSITADRQTKT